MEYLYRVQFDTVWWGILFLGCGLQNGKCGHPKTISVGGVREDGFYT